MNSSILAAELLKVRKRWLPYVLLLVLVGVVALQIFLAYSFWRGEDDFQERQGAFWRFALPWSLPTFLDTTQFWGAILLAILAASAVGTEHGWGTVRQALIRGQSRSQYLTTKLLGIVVLGGIGFLLAFGFGLAFSVLTTALADQPVTLDVPDGPSVPEVALMALRAAYGILPYALLAFCLAVVGRSTTLGMAGGLVYVFVESIVLATLGGAGGRTADARAFFMGHNVSALRAANGIGDAEYYGLAPREAPLPSELPDPAIAALVLALYCFVFLAVAFTVFQRRDIRA